MSSPTSRWLCLLLLAAIAEGVTEGSYKYLRGGSDSRSSSAVYADGQFETVQASQDAEKAQGDMSERRQQKGKHKHHPQVQRDGYAPIFMYEDIVDAENDLAASHRDLIISERVVQGDISRRNVAAKQVAESRRGEELARQKYITSVLEAGIGMTQKDQLEVTMLHSDQHSDRIQADIEGIQQSSKSNTSSAVNRTSQLAQNISGEMDDMREEYEHALQDAEQRAALATLAIERAKIKFADRRNASHVADREFQDAMVQLSTDTEMALSSAVEGDKAVAARVYHLKKGITTFKADNNTLPRSAASLGGTPVGLVSLLAAAACYAVL